jgi:phospholipid/cholesterol/gamma-HCH transport system substrate-binding protein
VRQSTLSRVIRAAVILAIAGGAIALVLSKVIQPDVGQGFHTWALFRDGSGLPVGSQVVIAGVRVGEIEALAVQNGLAKVSMRLRDDVVIWDDAFAAKRASSLLGDSYIEILPGGPIDTAPADAKWRRLASGERIPNVLEGGSTDEVLRSVYAALPRVDQQMRSAQEFLTGGRRYVSGPLRDTFENADRWLETNALGDPLARGARGAEQLDAWATRAANAVHDLRPELGATLDRTSGRLSDATTAIATAQATVVETLATARRRMDVIDPYVDRAVTALREYAGEVPAEEQGALATMINDDDLGQSLYEGTQGLKGYTDTLSRTWAWMGLRGEWNVLSGVPRLYVIAEITTRTDRFYLIELEKGGLGNIPHTTLTDELGSDTWTVRSRIKERIRFTAQWGKKVGPARFRFGIKESSFGAGFDWVFGDNRLKLSADLFEADFSRTPRLKLAASLAIFKYIYLIGGVDDALNDGAYLPIAPWPGAQDVPVWFEEVRYGRDYFFGAMLNITDADLATMLRVYGALFVAGLN